MKIVHILPDLYIGGGQKFTIDLCNELAQNPQNEVYLLSINKVDENSIMKKKIDPKVNFLSTEKEIGFSIGTMLKVYKILKKIKPDVVHSHLRGLAYASISLILLKIPNVHTVHNVASKEVGAKVRKYYNFLYKFFNSRPVSISTLVLETVKKEYGSNQNELIFNGTKALEKTDQFEITKEYIEKLKKTKDTRVFVNIARISEQKNQVMLVQAFEELIEQGEDVLLLIIGNGDKEYHDKCKRELKSKEFIIFEGAKSNIADYMICCDALCLSSLYEGLPIVILEAFSCGKPTITTPAGGVVDVVIENKTGYISDGFSKDKYVKTVKRFITSPQLKENIKEIFKNEYDIKITADRYLSLYQKVSKLS